MKTQNTLLIIISLIFLTNKTKAQIIYHDIPDTSIIYPVVNGLGSVTNHYNLDINHDNLTDFRFSLRKERSAPSPHGNFLEYVSQIQPQRHNQIFLTQGSSGCTKVLAYGDTINGNNNWANSGEIYVNVISANISCGLPFFNSYYGIKFKIGSAYHFGWLDLNVNSNGTILLKGYAYNTTPNAAIVAGDTIPPIVSSNNEESIDESIRMKLHPVPFSDFLHIEFQNITPPFQAKIRNISGQEVKEFEINSTLFTANLLNLDNGVYFLTIEDRNGVLRTKKIIKN